MVPPAIPLRPSVSHSLALAIRMAVYRTEDSIPKSSQIRFPTRDEPADSERIAYNFARMIESLPVDRNTVFPDEDSLLLLHGQTSA